MRRLFLGGPRSEGGLPSTEGSSIAPPGPAGRPPTHCARKPSASMSRWRQKMLLLSAASLCRERRLREGNEARPPNKAEKELQGYAQSNVLCWSKSRQELPCLGSRVYVYVRNRGGAGCDACSCLARSPDMTIDAPVKTWTKLRAAGI